MCQKAEKLQKKFHLMLGEMVIYATTFYCNIIVKKAISLNKFMIEI